MYDSDRQAPRRGATLANTTTGRCALIIPWRRSRSGLHKEKKRSHELLGPVVRFESAVLLPSIRGLSLELQSNSWMVLSGSDELGIALFCDLCFDFLQPEEGRVTSSLSSKDVSILGRSATTYGATVWEHITCGVSSISKTEILKAARFILRDPIFKGNASQEEFLTLLHGPISDLELSERSWLEISEVNTLLQKRKAVVIDTSSSFYEAALGYGFKHSELFTSRNILFIWISSDVNEIPDRVKPWLSLKDKSRLIELNFSSENHPKYIN